MEKLTETIPNFRIGKGTKTTIQKMADERKRKLGEFIRIHLEVLADKHNKGELEKNYLY